MPWTIHRFETVLFILGAPFFRKVNVLFVFVVVPADLPELGVEDVRSYHLLVAPDSVLRSKEFYEFVVNYSAVVVEEGTAWGQGWKTEELLTCTNVPVILFGQFLLVPVIILKLTQLGKRNTVDPLKLIFVLLTVPVSRTILCDPEPFYLVCRWDMGPRA